MEIDQALVIILIFETLLMTLVVPRLVFRMLMRATNNKKTLRRLRRWFSKITGIPPLDGPISLGYAPTAPPRPTAPPIDFSPIGEMVREMRLYRETRNKTPELLTVAAPSPPPGPAPSPVLPRKAAPSSTVAGEVHPPATVEDGTEEPSEEPSEAAKNGSDGGTESGRKRAEVAIRVELGATMLRTLIPVLPADAARKMARTAIKYPEMATNIICAYAARSGIEVEPQAVLEFLSSPLDENVPQNIPGGEVSEIG